MDNNPFFDILPDRLRSALVTEVPVEVTVGDEPVALRLTAVGAAGERAGLRVEVDVRRTADGRCVEWTTRIVNGSEHDIDGVEVVPVRFAFDPGDRTPRVRHLSGSWHYDALYPPRAFRLHEEAFVTHDHARRLTIGGTNAGIHSPVLQVGLGIPLEEALFVGLEWSGGWRLSAGWAEPSFSGEPRALFSVDGSADLGPLTLQPGASVVIPTVQLGADAVADWQDLDELQRRRMRELMPSTDLPSPLPVSYDTWFGRYHRFDIETLKADATRAAELGVEVFCLDACWYRSTDVSNGLGNWFTPDPQRFPRGEEDILELSRHVRDLGMRFGLWHLIQLAEADSDTVREHPELYRRPALKESRERNEREFGNLGGGAAVEFEGLVLALERREAVDFAVETLEHWIETWGVDWFRFESVPEDGLAYNAGYNQMLDTLRSRHPDLYIEACNGGGQRLDLNSVRRTQGNWLSDHTSSPEITRFQQTGAGRFWPTRMLNMAVTAFAGRGDENATRYEAMSRMAGVLSFNGAVSEWSDAATADVASAVGVYKSIRHLIDQEAYFPLRQPANVSDWDAVAYADAERNETVLMLFRLAGSPLQRITVPWLRWLDPELLLESADGASIAWQDDELVATLPERSAAIWRFAAS